MIPETQSISAAQRIAAESTKPKIESGFGTTLEHYLNPVQFSTHAQNQLRKRQITLNDDHLKQLSSAVSKLQEKNARESLVVMGDVALIVGVKDKTVITAMTTQTMKDHVVTNIDSAIVT